MKRFLPLLIVILVFGYIFSGGCTNSANRVNKPALQRFISVAASSDTEASYPAAGTVSEAFNRNIPGIHTKVQNTASFVENVNLLAQGKAEMSVISGDIAYYALTGTEMFKGKTTELRGIAVLYSEPVQIVTAADSGIKKPEELRGRRVAVGSKGSNTELSAIQILAAYGIESSNLSVAYLTPVAAAAALRDGTVDAAFFTAEVPLTALKETAAGRPLTILALTKEKSEFLCSAYPFYSGMTIPADTYAGQKQAVNTVAVKVLLVTTAQNDELLVYDSTKAIFSDLAEIKASIPAAEGALSLSGALDGMPIPTAAGAERFYQEQGK